MPAWNPCVAPACADTQSTRPQSEDIMFVYLYFLLKKTLERAEHSRRDAYLGAAVDIGELERRMRSMEMNH
jgi:hypothetical protein